MKRIHGQGSLAIEAIEEEITLKSEWEVLRSINEETFSLRSGVRIAVHGAVIYLLIPAVALLLYRRLPLDWITLMFTWLCLLGTWTVCYAASQFSYHSFESVVGRFDPVLFNQCYGYDIRLYVPLLSYILVLAPICCALGNGLVVAFLFVAPVPIFFVTWILTVIVARFVFRATLFRRCESSLMVRRQ
jgi:hypothetical protein